METWHVMHKKALKKCTGMPAPELELHKLMEPYKLVQAMLSGMKEHQGEQMMKKVLRKMMHGMGGMGHDDEEEDGDDGKMVRGLSDMEPDMTDFFQEFLKSSQAAKRFRRDADLADLGDKLTEKLQVAMKKWNAKMSNISCYIKEVKWVDSNMNLDKALVMSTLDDYKWDDQWLLKKSQDDIEKCFAVAQSIPKFVAEDFYSEKR